MWSIDNFYTNNIPTHDPPVTYVWLYLHWKAETAGFFLWGWSQVLKYNNKYQKLSRLMYGTICMITDRVEKNGALHCRMQGTVYTGKYWYTTKWRVRILNLCKKKYMHALAMTIEAHADKEGA